MSPKTFKFTCAAFSEHLLECHEKNSNDQTYWLGKLAALGKCIKEEHRTWRSKSQRGINDLSILQKWRLKREWIVPLYVTGYHTHFHHNNKKQQHCVRQTVLDSWRIWQESGSTPPFRDIRQIYVHWNINTAYAKLEIFVSSGRLEVVRKETISFFCIVGYMLAWHTDLCISPYT